jgi:hypothetical protein
MGEMSPARMQSLNKRIEQTDNEIKLNIYPFEKRYSSEWKHVKGGKSKSNLSRDKARDRIPFLPFSNRFDHFFNATTYTFFFRGYKTMRKKWSREQRTKEERGQGGEDKEQHCAMDVAQPRK